MKTTIIGGLVFLVPVVVLVLIVGEAVKLMMAVAEPLASIVPVDSIAGVATANLIALLAILLLCFLTGLAASTRPAALFAAKLEAALLNKLPGYAMLKGFTSSLTPGQQAELKPVLVRLDDRERIGLEVERVDDDRRAVYFPGTPHAWAGTVEILSADRIVRLDVPMADVIGQAELFGRTSAHLLSRCSDHDQTG